MPRKRIKNNDKRKEDKKCLRCFWPTLFATKPMNHRIDKGTPVRHIFSKVRFLVIREESGIRLEAKKNAGFRIYVKDNYIGVISI